MRASRTVAGALALLFFVGVLAVSVQAAPGIQKNKNPAAKSVTKGMPKEVAALIQEGLATRQGRQDIPFAFFKQLVFPAQADKLFPIYFFKTANGALGYAPSAAGTGELEAALDVYFQFFQPAADGALKAGLGGKCSVVLKTPSEGYSAEAEDFYSFGLGRLGLATGQYTLALVLSTPDMRKLSVAYSDLDMTRSEAQKSGFWLTDPVIVKSADQVEPDQQATVHRGYFTWGGLKVVPNAKSQIGSADVLDTLFFAVGAASKPMAEAEQMPKNDLEVTAQILAADGQAQVQWAPTVFDLFVINIQLPVEKAVEIETTNEKGEVSKRQEKRPLPAGDYTLVVSVADRVSGKKADARMAFAVK